MLHARKINLSFAMATNQIQQFGLNSYGCLRTTQGILPFLNFFFLSKIWSFGCHGHQSKPVIWTKFIWLVEDYSRNISAKLLSKYLHNTEINANFQFSHYKYMETLSCHCNESTLATTIKNILYVEDNIMNIYAKFQLHPPYGF